MTNLPYYILLFLTLVLSSENKEENKSYYGNWPITKNKLSDLPDTQIDCPGDTGCSCLTNDDCNNTNCIRMPRGKYCAPKVGDQFPNFIGMDQYGDEVSVYDFSNNGKYILIEMAAPWCAPCREIADWLTYNNTLVFKRRWFKGEYVNIRTLIQNDEIYYITILFEDMNKNNITFDTLYDWFQKYPDEKVPILADSERFLHTWIKPTGLPAALLLNEEMEIVVFSTRGINAAFDKVTEIYENE